MLLFTASEIETATVSVGVNPAVAGLLGGMGGGIAQAYATMGEFPHETRICWGRPLNSDRAPSFIGYFA